ncbi:alpha-galactosidase [Dipodascopsis uninucleata]
MTASEKQGSIEIKLPERLKYKLRLLTDLQHFLSVEVPGKDVFYFRSPDFEVDGTLVSANVSSWSQPLVEQISSDIYELVSSGPVRGAEHLTLSIVLRIAPSSPVIRFKYLLDGSGHLTKSSGCDNLCYTKVSLSKTGAKEIRLSEYLEPVHSYTLNEIDIKESEFNSCCSYMGPIIAGHGQNGTSVVISYEHGSQYPDRFLRFQLDPSGGLAVKAVKGNYTAGQVLATAPFSSIFFDFAAIDGTIDQLASEFREFLLKYMAPNPASRSPYIFYNTWNRQERQKHWFGGKYLDPINQEFILRDIDRAYAMGIDVYVIDVGWYSFAGDWLVDTNKFPDGLAEVKNRLNSYGMRLGLWFEPKSAAISSKLYIEHKDCTMSWDGTVVDPEKVWDSEEAYQMCLVSRYSEDFADKLIERARTLGVTYFKWDAISQYGCNSPDHYHGDASCSAGDRADSYAFQLGLYMVKIVERLSAAIPEAIVDFDVTEGSRFVGLSFLSAGKFFLINNGPYHMNYNFPFPPQIKKGSSERNPNLFFYPGPARAWICRTPLVYDKWIPSILFLTHYYPDDSEPIDDKYVEHNRYIGASMLAAKDTDAGAEAQKANIASLILGQNGIWGDLHAISDAGVARMHLYLSKYKAVREDVTAAQIIKVGNVGGNPEVYEKINPSTGRGVVVIFSSSFGRPLSTRLQGRYTYVTANTVVSKFWHDHDGINVRINEEGKAVIDVTFDEATGKTIFFD